MTKRTGTRMDKDKLKTTFTNLGFQLRVFDDRTADEIREDLRQGKDYIRNSVQSNVSPNY